MLEYFHWKIDCKSRRNGEELDIAGNIWIPPTEISSWKPISDGAKIRTDFQTYSLYTSLLFYVSISFVRLLSCSLSCPLHRGSTQSSTRSSAQSIYLFRGEHFDLLFYSARYSIKIETNIFHGRFDAGCCNGGGGCDLLNPSAGKIDLFLWYLCVCGCVCACIQLME